MTVEIERDALLAALRQVTDVVEARNTIPVLSNLLVVVAEGKLTLTGTDLDLEASAWATAAGDIRTTVAADKFLAAVTSFKSGKLTIAPVAARQAITVKQGRGVRTLPTIGADDFPKRAPLKAPTSFTITGAALARLFGACAVAQSTDETRYYLNGIFLHVVDGQLVAAATDGHRMVRAETALPPGADSLPDTIVPTKAVTLIRKLLFKVEAEVSISLNETAIEFAIGSCRIVSKVVDGTYPDYSRVIPPISTNKLEVGRDAFTAPLASVAAVVNAEGDKIKTRSVTFELGTEADTYEVTAKDMTGNSASEPLECTYSGVPVRFGLNNQYAQSVASIFTEDATLSITLADPAAPLRLVSDKDPDLVAVIMPMRA